MRLLALVPARGGSKRLPGKNILPLAGKPLICWSIDCAKLLDEVVDCLVSTDDAMIARIATEAGALVPWLRPEHLSTDSASSAEMAIHALDWYESQRGPVDGLLLLQPTSPLRKRSMLAQGIEIFQRHPNAAVVGVAHTPHHPLWTFRLDNGKLQPWCTNQDAVQSQELPPALVVTGSFYLIEPNKLRSTKTFIPPESLPLIQNDPCDLIDIDDMNDFEQAQRLAQSLH